MALKKLTRPKGSIASKIMHFSSLMKERLRMYFEQGTYEVDTAVLQDAQERRGEGLWNTKLEFKKAGAMFTSDEVQDAKFKDLSLLGLGKSQSTEQDCIQLLAPSNKNNLRTRLDNVRIQGFNGAGIVTNNGWGHSIKSSRITDCKVGLQTKEGWVSGWGGSGYTTENLYIAGCDTGIDLNYQWCSTHINPVIEYNGVPITWGGNNNVMLNPWIEGNTGYIKVVRGGVCIGGRGVTLDMTGMTAFEPTEAFTHIDKNGIVIYRDNTTHPILKVDGEGLKRVASEIAKTASDGADIVARGTAYSGSGSVMPIKNILVGGNTTDQAKAEDRKVAVIGATLSADSSNTLYGNYRISLGSVDRDGNPGNTHPLTDLFEFRYDGELRPLSTKTRLGSSTHKYAYSYVQEYRGDNMVLTGNVTANRVSSEDAWIKTVNADVGGLTAKSPNGKRWRLSPPDNGGAATWVAVS